MHTVAERSPLHFLSLNMQMLCTGSACIVTNFRMVLCEASEEWKHLKRSLVVLFKKKWMQIMACMNLYDFNTEHILLFYAES